MPPFELKMRAHMATSASVEPKSYFDTGAGINLVDCVTRSTASLPVQIVALNEDGLLA